jgi:BirA family biotin operon repressor/biotin-[acetyl-CoA-carboxylase] ligase
MLMNYKEVGNQIIKLNSVDSTNNYAAKLLKQTKVPFGTVIMAHYQTNGKGQRNASWDSSEKDNLLMSVLLDTSSISPNMIFYLSKIVALSIRSLLEKYELGQAQIKWPNDVIIDKMKLSGVLIENKWKNSFVSSSIVGIGLNVNQISFSGFYNACSLKSLTSVDYDIDEVLKSICKELSNYFKLLVDKEFAKIDSEYHEHLVNFNKWAKFLENGQAFNAKVIGVNQQGELMLELTDGKIRNFELKEITQLL